MSSRAPVPSGRLAHVVEPLPRRAKVFFGAIAVLLIGAAAWRLTGGNEGPAIAAAWRVDPGADLEPKTREIPIIVNEAECASGRSADGRIEVDVTYEAEAVRHGIRRPARRAAGRSNCRRRGALGALLAQREGNPARSAGAAEVWFVGSRCSRCGVMPPLVRRNREALGSSREVRSGIVLLVASPAPVTIESVRLCVHA
jgi:hypothetical protein